MVVAAVQAIAARMARLSSRWRSTWDLLMLAIILWHWTVIPFRLVFLEGFIFVGPEYNVHLFLVDCVLDSLLIIDTLLRWGVEPSCPRVSSIAMPEAEFGARPEFLSRVSAHGAARAARQDERSFSSYAGM